MAQLYKGNKLITNLNIYKISFNFEIVSVLPTTGEANVMYLLSNGTNYDAYLYKNSTFVKVASAEVDSRRNVKFVFG